MKTSCFSQAQLIGILRPQGQGQPVAQVGREHGSSEPTVYQGKSKYAGLELPERQRLQHLKEENRRLNQRVADRRLQNQVAQPVRRKKEGPQPSGAPWPSRR